MQQQQLDDYAKNDITNVTCEYDTMNNTVTVTVAKAGISVA